MLHSKRSAFALLAAGLMALPVSAQTTGSTGSTATGTTGGATATGGGGATSGGGGGTAKGGSSSGSTGSGSSGAFAATTQSGFSGGTGTTTATNSSSGGGTGKGGTSTTSPTSFNPFLATYGSPYNLGQSVMGSGSKSTTSAKGFGVALYASTTTTTTSAATSKANAASGFANTNVSRVPRYTTNLGDGVQYVAHVPSQMQSDLQRVLDRNANLRNRVQIQVDGTGAIYVTGQVANAREARAVISQLALTPGAGNFDMVNQLVYPGQEAQ